MTSSAFCQLQVKPCSKFHRQSFANFLALIEQLMRVVTATASGVG